MQDTLRILQYNVHKRKDTMLLLSAHEHTRIYDIVTIQEPARNGHVHATFCDSSSQFIPLYPRNHHTRACFFLNKRLPRDSWNAEFPSPDIAILDLQLPSGPLRLINVYNEPSPRTTYNPQSPILALEPI